MLPSAVHRAIVIAFLRSTFLMLRPYFWISLMALILVVGQTSAADSSSPSAPTASSTPGAVVGTSIQFNAGGNSERYRVSGWSQTEKDFTWSEGKMAKLALPIPANVGALTLNMKLGALVSSPTVASQTVEVIANGQKIADWQVADTADLSARIPAEVTKNGGTLSIELRVPNATSPKALGLGDDSRILGVRVYSVELKRP